MATQDGERSGGDVHLNAKVREAVFARAKNRCEAGGCRRTAKSLDHFFGRAKATETVENCWALCRDHDSLKTLNQPSGHEWCWKFKAHCERHGYAETAKQAKQKAEWLIARRGTTA